MESVSIDQLERFEIIRDGELTGTDFGPDQAVLRCYSFDPQGRIWIQMCASEDALTLYEAHARAGYPKQFSIYGGNGVIEVAPYFPNL